MLWQRTFLASLLAIGAEAGIGDLVVEGLSRNSPSVERKLQNMAKGTLMVRGHVQPRQSTESEGSAPLKADGSLDVEAWNEVANKACRDALRNLPLASNPSGACVCYNLPILNNSTGTFEADLRLFQINEPTGNFQGVPQEKIEVELSYTGASVSEVKSTGETQNVETPPTAAGLSARQDNGGELKLLQSYLFIGEVDKDRMSDQVSEAQLQALVMPVVTLKGTNGDGKTVSTNVSSNEAAFVTGEFSQKLMSNFTLAQLSVEQDMAALKNGTVAFVLPGVQIMIFPVGLIITSVWMVLFVIAYGAGTYARYNFREAHRRRMAVIEKSGVARI